MDIDTVEAIDRLMEYDLCPTFSYLADNTISSETSQSGLQVLFANEIVPSKEYSFQNYQDIIHRSAKSKLEEEQLLMELDSIFQPLMSMQ